MKTIGECLAGAYANGRLVPHQGALQWVASADDDLDRVLWEIGRAAGRLVVSPRLARVRACAASDCGWWFVDDTKNRSRRWCDMKLCGNREKLRRFREEAVAFAHVDAALLASLGLAQAQAPATFTVRLDTTKGPIVIECVRAGRRLARIGPTSWCKRLLRRRGVFSDSAEDVGAVRHRRRSEGRAGVAAEDDSR